MYGTGAWVLMWEEQRSHFIVEEQAQLLTAGVIREFSAYTQNRLIFKTKWECGNQMFDYWVCGLSGVQSVITEFVDQDEQ